RAVWDQELISENQDVYRAEYLAYRMLEENVPADSVNEFMSGRYAEGYVKGVHDEDGRKLIEGLLPIHEQAGRLRHSMTARACGLVFWEWFAGDDKKRLAAKLKALGRMREAFGQNGEGGKYEAELVERIEMFLEDSHLFEQRISAAAGAYLVDELTSEGGAAVSAEAAKVVKAFYGKLASKRAKSKYQEAMGELQNDVVGRFQVTSDWIHGSADEGEDEDVILEAAAHELRGGFEQRDVVEAATRVELAGMLGDHPRVAKGNCDLDYNEFLTRLGRFEAEVVPSFQAYHDLKNRLVDEKRDSMRLEEFKPNVMSAFVRNRLLDEVYLPLIGDNLAKQLGTAGADTRTDRMGLLLLVSPPGYGKTTLMEYVANRLGITFVKINGPAIGHHVTSLDPAEAPNASAREEVKKLNFALEMGDNVMIYLDDIQHCDPEFLQKFISLCDAQRKIEGVWDGKARTYDLRGKKVAVVMAGNPYTESGGKFQIPDMLANRADTYNLGDIIGENDRAFKDSYIENSLTSNSVLSKLSSRSQKDIYAVMHVAATGSQEGADFEGNYSVEEIDEMVSVTKKLMRIRETILRVNLEYIRSAAMEDAYRTEPAFKLQGSYRNMNRIAEKVLPIMTDDEIEGLILSHYENEAQTLTTGAEANLLKFKELEGKLSETEAERWAEIQKTFNKNQLLAGADENDPVTRVVAQLSQIGESLQTPQLGDDTIAKLEKVIAGLRAVPVEVEVKVLPVQEVEVEKKAEVEEPPPPPPTKKKKTKVRKKKEDSV
ncbi:MAG: AAA family ATPase, partial [Verrucomicrobiota bacterium]